MQEKWSEKLNNCIQYFPAKGEQSKKNYNEMHGNYSQHASCRQHTIYILLWHIYSDNNKTTSQQHSYRKARTNKALFRTWIAFKLICCSQRNQSTWFASSTYLICHTQDRTELQIQWSMQTFKQTTNCNLHFASM